jgi:hypothetical protein
MIYSVKPLLEEDLAVCANYVSEEYEELTGIPAYKHSRGSLVAGALLDYKGYKVVDEKEKIVAFIMFEEDAPYLHVVTWFIAKGYRVSEPLYLLSKVIADKVDLFEYVVYIELSKKMRLPKNVCVKGRIINKEYKEWFEVLKKRWG